MTERPITFPKTDDGVWTNRETGVEIQKEDGGYRPYRPTPNGKWIGISLAKRTLADAKSEAVSYIDGSLRFSIAAAYVEAVAEHVERAARKAEEAGAPTWRADAARRMTQYDNGSSSWLAATINEVRRLEEWTAEYAHTWGRGLSIDAAHAQALELADERREDEWNKQAYAKAVELGLLEDGEMCGPYDDPRETAAARALLDDLRGEAEREDWRRHGVKVGDLVVFTDPEGLGIDTDTVWTVVQTWNRGTINASADLDEHPHGQMRSASYFDRLAPAPRCTKFVGWSDQHEFDDQPSDVKDPVRCGRLRSDECHNTDRERAARTIHAARNHEGAPAGRPVEWPGTTVIRGETGSGKSEMTAEDLREHIDLSKADVDRQFAAYANAYAAEHGAAPVGSCRHCGQSESDHGARLYCPIGCGRFAAVLAVPAAPAELDDDTAWAQYAAALPEPTDAQIEAVAAEFADTYTAARVAAVDGFRNAARTLWTLRSLGRARRESAEYIALRQAMTTFRRVIRTYDEIAADQGRMDAATS